MHSIRNLACAGVSLLALASPAMAQDAPAEGLSANEIVVSARRREESIQDVPAVVQAVTAEDLQRLNLRKFEDITSVVPGLSLTANSNGIGSVNTLRGVNFDVNISGNSATVEFYYNGAPISSNAVLQSMFDVGQVEVLRGPQGTLQGRASPSGSINITMRRPDLDAVGGYANFTVNDIHGYNVNGAINVPVIANKLAVRVAGVVSDDQGSRVRPVNDPGAKLNNASEGLRASVAADPFDGILKLDFSYQTFRRKGLQYQQVESFTANRYFNAANPNSPLVSPIFITAEDRDAVANNIGQQNQQRFKIFNWQAQLALWGQRLTYLGGHLNQRLQAVAPSDNAGIFTNQFAPLGFFTNNPAAPALTGEIGPFAQDTDTLAKSTSHEIRLQNEERVFDRFDYVIGFLSYGLKSDTNFNRIVGAIATPAPPALPTSIVNIQFLPLNRFTRSLERSIFGNLTFHLTDATEISGGARHIWYKTEGGLRIAGVEQANLRTCSGYGSVGCGPQEKAWIYTASIKHKFSDDLMVYASTGSSWRAPTIVIGGPTQATGRPMSALQAQFQQTPPEKSKSYEIGIKSDWLDDQLRVNVTAFYQKFTNYPYRNLSGVYSIAPSSFDTVNGVCAPAAQGGCRVEAPQYASAVPVTVQGVEAELFFRPSERFNLGAVLTYTDGKIKNGLTPCTDLNGDGADDQLFSPPSAAALLAATGANFVDVCTINQRANASPSWSGSLTAEYNLPVSDANEAYLRGLYTWRGKSQGEPTNPVDQIKAYGILNLFAGLRDAEGAWDLGIYGKNITNTLRVLTNIGPQTTSTLSHGTLSFTNYYGISVTEPREFGVNLRIAFGSR